MRICAHELFGRIRDDAANNFGNAKLDDCSALATQVYRHVFRKGHLDLVRKAKLPAWGCGINARSGGWHG
jgi:hypothetical protein